MRSRWYEKLNDWDKALSLVAECRVERSVGGGNEAKYKESEVRRGEEKEGGRERGEKNLIQLDEHEVKCLEALGKWSELKKKVGDLEWNDRWMRWIYCRQEVWIHVEIRNYL